MQKHSVSVIFALRIEFNINEGCIIYGDLLFSTRFYPVNTKKLFSKFLIEKSVESIIKCKCEDFWKASIKALSNKT